jgi:hypothetical protein
MFDQSVRDDLETIHGAPFSEKEWAALRQCLRCLRAGKRIARRTIKPGTPEERTIGRVIDVPDAGSMDPRSAIRKVMALAKGKNIHPLAAARELVFVWVE